MVNIGKYQIYRSVEFGFRWCVPFYAGRASGLIVIGWLAVSW